MKGISSTQSNPTLANKYKTFQGQKFDDDLGINWYSFKYRNHDPQIGRFVQIDPLASDYVYNSTYAFSENKVTGHIELEGLESVGVNPDYSEEQYKPIQRTEHFREAYPNEWKNRPLHALMMDAGWLLASITGLTAIDNAVSTYNNPKATVGDKIFATLGAGLATTRGEGEAGGIGGGKKGSIEPVELIIDGNKHPEAAQNAIDAMDKGISGEGVIDRKNASSRRREDLKGIETKKGKDRDEFPPAVINNNGNGKQVRHINSSDNRGAGASLGQQMRNLPDNTRVIIKVLPKMNE